MPGPSNNILNVKYNHVHYESGKVKPVETSLGVGAEGIKENDGGSEFNCDIL
jgi:hypothetical protein